MERRKSLVFHLTERLGNVLRPFENKYMGGYTEWMMTPIQKAAENPKATEDIRKRAKRRLSNENLLRFGFMQEAAEGYAVKFAKLVSKVADVVDSLEGLKVETIRNNGMELEFLISNYEIEVHARAIFVNGAIKAPHYRFITTTRRK